MTAYLPDILKKANINPAILYLLSLDLRGKNFYSPPKENELL